MDEKQRESFLEEFAPNVVSRLERIEDFLFEDKKDNDGKVIKPSLETVVMKVNNHIDVMCDWARAAKKILRWIMLIGGAYGYIMLLVHLVGDVFL